MSQKLLLKWKNHMNIMNEFKHFLTSGTMIDVTLVCEGQSIKAHKIVLSACSSLFRSLFLENPCKHPIVILKDMKCAELKSIIDFMYCGEVDVEANEVPTLIKVAQNLKVSGLGEVESENDHFSYDSENPSGDEYENLSEEESINESVCTLDVHNGSFVEEQLMVVQNDNEDPTSEIMIMQTPEIKEEEVLSENKSHNDPCSCLSAVPFKSYPISSSKSKRDMPDLERESVTTNNLPRKSSQSSVQSNMEQHQNHSDDIPSLVSETSILVSPDQPLRSSSPLSMEQHQSHSDNMPGLFTITPTLSNKELNKNHLHKIPNSLSIKSTHVSTGQSFQPSAQSSMHLHNAPGSLSVTSTVSQEQSFQSSIQSILKLNKIHSDNISNSLTIIPTPVSSGQSFQSSAQSNMKLNKNQSNYIPNSLTVTSTPVSQGQSFQDSNMKLNKNHSDNKPGSLFTITPTPVSQECTFQSSSLPNMKLNKIQSDNVPNSLAVTSTPVSQGHSFQSNMKLNRNHFDNIPGLLTITPTPVSQEHTFQSSALLNMKPNKNRSDNIPGSSAPSKRVLSNARATDSQQPATSTVSCKRMKKIMKLRKLPSRIAAYERQQQNENIEVKNTEEPPIHQPRILREPEILIIRECQSKKDKNCKTKNSRKTYHIKRCRKK